MPTSLVDIQRDSDSRSAFEPGGGGLGGLATVSTYIDNFHLQQTVATAGVTASDRIIAAIAPHSDTDENHETMLNLSVLSASAGTGQITFTLTFNEPTSGPIKINWSAM